MSLPFIDLKAQYAALKTTIDARIQRVLDHGQYIMGPEVQELETALAAYAGTLWLDGNGFVAAFVAGLAFGNAILQRRVLRLQIDEFQLRAHVRASSRSRHTPSRST